MAVENFVEMRDHTAKKAFYYKKQLEHWLHGHLPNLLSSQYNLVSFSTVPYTEARAKGKQMDMAIRGLVTAGTGAAAYVALRGVLGVPPTLALLAAGAGAYAAVDRVLPKAHLASGSHVGNPMARL